MSIPKINEFRLLLAVMTELVIIRSSLACDGRTIMHAGVTDYDKQVILDSHNRIRQLVALGQVGNQPAAANMMQLSWSDELASKAQQWAMTCTSYTHDPRRHISQYYVGQNIATKWTTQAPVSFDSMQPNWIDDAISKWFNEYSQYNFHGFVGGATGHYTQLIWAETTAVGCGYVYYLDPRKKYTKKYVCNYGPSGNVRGELPYQKGYPNCFSYGLTESRKHPGLCAKSAKHYKGNILSQQLLHWLI